MQQTRLPRQRRFFHITTHDLFLPGETMLKLEARKNLEEKRYVSAQVNFTKPFMHLMQVLN